MGLDLIHFKPCPKEEGDIEYFELTDFSHVTGFAEKYVDIIEAITDEEGTIWVVYKKGIGYQRKGMKATFFEAFEDCHYYHTKADVIRAAQYLEHGYEESFRRNFIDNFVEGESFFLASW